MTDRALEELAARVEALTRPDREVDIAILTSVLGYRDIHGDRTLFDRGNDGYWSLDGDEMNPPLPSPTASIDAAMTLVPEGHTNPGDIVRAALKRLGEKFHLHAMHWPLVTPYPGYLARFVTAAALRAIAGKER
jgi:hypothetical protein